MSTSSPCNTRRDSITMAHQWITVQTTLPCVPFPPSSQREPLRTERMVIRRLDQGDLIQYHQLRSQPEAMAHTRLGRPDRDLAETVSALQEHLPPHDRATFRFGAFLASTGALVGEGGVHTLRSAACGWPEVVYYFRREVRGQGYPIEFLRGFLALWWALPRTYITIPVFTPSVAFGNGALVTEHLAAYTAGDTGESRRVLEEVGFVAYSEWTEPDIRLHRRGQPLRVVGFVTCKR
ncbi:acyl-CoA N-acyltransferase [Hypoxylon sp. FL0543]|nr:acyl-CoA N-acyltransferase [Hypoxylon sp. FL0543]